MSNFIEVTENKFWEHIGPRDIVLDMSRPECVVWKMRYGSTVGKSVPGWRNPGDKESFYLIDGAIK